MAKIKWLEIKSDNWHTDNLNKKKKSILLNSLILCCWPESVVQLLLCFLVSTHSPQGEFDWQRAGLPEPSCQLSLSPWEQRQTLHDHRWAVVCPLWWLHASHPHFCLHPRFANTSPTPLLSSMVFKCITCTSEFHPYSSNSSPSCLHSFMVFKGNSCTFAFIQGLWMHLTHFCNYPRLLNAFLTLGTHCWTRQSCKCLAPPPMFRSLNAASSLQPLSNVFKRNTQNTICICGH